MTRHRIPVRVGTKTVSTRSVYPEAPEAPKGPEETREQASQGSRPTRVGDPRLAPATEVQGESQPAPVSDAHSGLATEVSKPAYSESEQDEQQTNWRDRALRMQAEMDNYRKRQRRIAQEEAQAGQERLLRDVLSVADNLDRTLAAGQQHPSELGPVPMGGSDGLRRGVELTRDELLRILSRYGLERFEAKGEPFDPAWHEAVHVVSARALGVEPGTVVEQIQPGYRKDDAVHGERLFRPAKVVVAN